MANEVFKVGQAFRVTCDIRKDNVALIDTLASTGVVINYRRPDGTMGTITPDQITANTVSGKVTATINPRTTTDASWLNGYPGTWEFVPSGTDAAGDPWEGDEAAIVVHSRFRNVK